MMTFSLLSSHFWIGGRLLIDNGGVHAESEKCAWKVNLVYSDISLTIPQNNLAAGLYPVKVDWFTADDSYDVRVTYKGPDTSNDVVLLPSKSANGPPIPAKSAWLMKVFVANDLPYELGMPDISTMTEVASKPVPYIDFDKIEEFREVSVACF